MENIYRIHELKEKEQINLKIKAKNIDKILLKILKYSKKEILIKEADNGRVLIPFSTQDIPKL